MRTAKHTVRKGGLALFVLSLCCAMLIGAAPAMFTILVDPYELFGERIRAPRISELAEKDHYPLWKLARYKRGAHDTVILGDSRARALREKYWHELGMKRAINLAYGGGTIPEIHATFDLIKSDGAIRNLVIGIQLRSFDEKHKGGMNRVPEAVRLLSARTEYLKNWSVAKTAFKVLKAENEDTVEWLNSISPTLVASASAQEPGQVPLETLLSPEICFSCPLHHDARPTPQRRWFGRYAGTHLPSWELADTERLWDPIDATHFLPYYVPQHLQRVLPAKMQRQIDRNAPSDWRGFELSERYWHLLEEISAYAHQRDINLTFVIPPTVIEMQATIEHHGLAALNIGLRAELAKLGTVVDFDFPNALTSKFENFSDAYHFRPTVARAIVGELVSQLAMPHGAKSQGLIPQPIIRCPVKSANVAQTVSGGDVVMVGDHNCRRWIRKGA
ncbi:MAG: hypothetical protein NXI27_24810 [Alphaproteobacteria bacterium]|nr:hypothetical protein [Alphaproteobacteria bacterium]